MWWQYFVFLSWIRQMRVLFLVKKGSRPMRKGATPYMPCVVKDPILKDIKMLEFARYHGKIDPWGHVLIFIIIINGTNLTSGEVEIVILRKSEGELSCESPDVYQKTLLIYFIQWLVASQKILNQKKDALMKEHITRRETQRPH